MGGLARDGLSANGFSTRQLRISDAVTFDGDEEIETAGMAFDTFGAPDADTQTTVPQATKVEIEDDIF